MERKMAQERPELTSAQGQLAALRVTCENWQDRYERIFEAHMRMQKVNQGLEDKLLRLVDRNESEKSRLSQDMSNLTSALTNAAQTINRLKAENVGYRRDIKVISQLLQCNRNQYPPCKVDNLPKELKEKAKAHTNVQNVAKPTTKNTESKIIRVPIPTFPPGAVMYSIDNNNKGDYSEEEAEKDEESDAVSVAILAAIIEEREKEKSLRHCATCTCKIDFAGTDKNPGIIFDNFDHFSNSQNLAENSQNLSEKSKNLDFSYNEILRNTEWSVNPKSEKFNYETSPNFPTTFKNTHFYPNSETNVVTTTTTEKLRNNSTDSWDSFGHRSQTSSQSQEASLDSFGNKLQNFEETERFSNHSDVGTQTIPTFIGSLGLLKTCPNCQFKKAESGKNFICNLPDECISDCIERRNENFRKSVSENGFHKNLKSNSTQQMSKVIAPPKEPHHKPWTSGALDNNAHNLRHSFSWDWHPELEKNDIKPPESIENILNKLDYKNPSNSLFQTSRNFGPSDQIVPVTSTSFDCDVVKDSGVPPTPASLSYESEVSPAGSPKSSPAQGIKKNGNFRVKKKIECEHSFKSDFRTGIRNEPKSTEDSKNHRKLECTSENQDNFKFKFSDNFENHNLKTKFSQKYFDSDKYTNKSQIYLKNNLENNLIDLQSDSEIDLTNKNGSERKMTKNDSAIKLSRNYSDKENNKNKMRSKSENNIQSTSKKTSFSKEKFSYTNGNFVAESTDFFEENVGKNFSNPLLKNDENLRTNFPKKSESSKSSSKHDKNFESFPKSDEYSKFLSINIESYNFSKNVENFRKSQPLPNNGEFRINIPKNEEDSINTLENRENFIDTLKNEKKILSQEYTEPMMLSHIRSETSV